MSTEKLIRNHDILESRTKIALDDHAVSQQLMISLRQLWWCFLTGPFY